jgi:vitamin B12 transporter
MRRVHVCLLILCSLMICSSAAASAGDPAGTTVKPANSGTTKKPANRKKAAANAHKKTVRRSPGQQKKLPRMLIVVTPTRMPQPLSEIGTTVSVVTSGQLQSQKISGAIDALREVPGVDVTQSGSPGSVATVSIRGATSGQTLIMLDGVPLNDAATGLFDVNRLTTYNLEQIEVVRGAGGALYGSQAIGGVVNMLTREGSGPLKFSLSSEGGNRATERQVLTANGAEGKLAYSGSLNYFSSEGYRLRNDNSDNLAGSLSLDYHLDEDTTLRGFAHYIRANVSLPQFSVFSGVALNPNAHQRNEFMLYKGEIDRRFGERLHARLSGYFLRDELRVNTVAFPGNASAETDHIPEETRGANLETVYTWARGFRSLLGFDFKDRWAHSQSDFGILAPPPPVYFLTVFNARRQEYAGYVEQEGRFFNGHVLGTGGFRIDGNTQFGKEVSPAWSVAIPIEEAGVTLRGSYAEGFRAPSFNELFFPGFGNPNLKPEISSEYDGGITKNFGEMMSFTATYFSRRIHQQIIAVPCMFNPASCPFGAQPANAERVDTQGVELVPSLRPLGGLTLGGNVTILDQTHATPPNVVPKPRPLRVPKYSAEALVQYTHGDIFRSDDRFTTSLAYTFVGDRDDITTSSTVANHDAYHRFDLAVVYSPAIRWGVVRNEEVFTRVQNLFDRHYSEVFGFPAPPVNFTAGLKLDF